jgi:hypothetical protein
MPALSTSVVPGCGLTEPLTVRCSLTGPVMYCVGPGSTTFPVRRMTGAPTP